MRRLYVKMAEQIYMTDESRQRVRSELARRFEQTEQEEQMKMNKALRRPRTAIIAAAVVCALSVSAFAAGSLSRVFHMMTGGVIVQGPDSMEGAPVESIAPIETAADGRVYFVANGEHIDITDQFSYETPYTYDCVDEAGARHLFIVGGRPGETGWSEFILDQDGMPVGGSSELGTSGGSDDAPWLKAGLEQFELPWANMM